MDFRALTLIGASSKRNENKIGRFGSGNKYALAYFLKNNLNPVIYSGEELIDVKVSKTTFRDQEFDVITINGQETSLTTDMGPDWECWEAMREIYSNALDEGDASITINNEPIFEKGYTCYSIKFVNEVIDFYKYMHNYFVKDDNVLFANEEGRILSKQLDKPIVFRKGIRCFQYQYEGIFNYDFTYLNINEQREATYSWQIVEQIWKLISSCTDKDIIYKFIETISNDPTANLLELNLDFTAIVLEPSKEFKEVLASREIVLPMFQSLMEDEAKESFWFIPDKIFNLLSQYNIKTSNKVKKTATNTAFTVIDGTDDEKKHLKNVLNTLSTYGINIPYPIHLARFNEGSVYGMADLSENMIYLNPDKFIDGETETMNTLLEEYVHLKHHTPDGSRNMQRVLINEWLNTAKKLFELNTSLNNLN